MTFYIGWPRYNGHGILPVILILPFLRLSFPWGIFSWDEWYRASADIWIRKVILSTIPPHPHTRIMSGIHTYIHPVHRHAHQYTHTHTLTRTNTQFLRTLHTTSHSYLFSHTLDTHTHTSLHTHTHTSSHIWHVHFLFYELKCYRLSFLGFGINSSSCTRQTPWKSGIITKMTVHNKCLIQMKFSNKHDHPLGLLL